MALHCWENRFCLAAFTVVTALFFSYMNTIAQSSQMRLVADSLSQYQLLKKANATIGNAVHVFQAFSLSFPAKE